MVLRRALDGDGFDAFLAKIQQAYVGTVLCDVRSLSAQWEDCNNRDVDPDHIEKLKARFKVVGIQRTTEEHRMKATVKQAEWQQLLAVIRENTLCQDFHQGSSQTELSGPLQEIVKDPIQMTIVPRDLPVTPILEAGQHRQHALVELLEEQDRIAKSEEGKAGGIKPPIDHDYKWATDIYIHESLDLESLFALRANREQLSKIDNNGDVLVRMVKLYEEKPLIDKCKLLRPRNLKNWMIQAFGCAPEFVGRLLNVLRSESLRPYLVEFCKTRYGAQQFRLTWASNVVLSNLDFIWRDVIQQFIDISFKIFGPKMFSIPARDWDAIMQVPTADNKEKTLRLLFFPTSRDVRNGHLSSKPLQLSHTNTTAPLPEMKPFHSGGKNFNTRRPGFLSILDDDEYCKVFQFLVDHPEISIPSWKSWNILDAYVSKTTIQLLKHVLLWCDPNWTFPERAGLRRRNFEWSQEVLKVVVGPSKLSNDGEQEVYSPTTDDLELSETLIREVWSYVETNSVWKERHVQLEVSEDPAESLGPNAEKSSFDEYAKRFQHDHWADLLGFFLDQSGPVLGGFMKRFNNHDALQENQNKDGFGHISAMTNWKENKNVTSNRFLSGDKVRDEFIKRVDIVGAEVCYRRLKQVLVTTLADGYPEKDSRESMEKDRIKYENEWISTVGEMKKYASILDNANVSIDLDNINELDNGPRKPGLLSSKLNDDDDDDDSFQLPITPGKRRHTVNDEETREKKIKQEDLRREIDLGLPWNSQLK